MRRLASIGALFLGIGLASLATAQGEAYVPALADIMSAVQWRHIKLWFAGKRQNWDLASYELRQIKTSLEDAANLYRGIPVEYVGTTVEPIQTITAAIEAKDRARFAKGFNALTAVLQRLSPRNWPRLHHHSGSHGLALRRPVICAAEDTPLNRTNEIGQARSGSSWPRLP